MDIIGETDMYIAKSNVKFYTLETAAMPIGQAALFDFCFIFSIVL